MILRPYDDAHFIISQITNPFYHIAYGGIDLETYRDMVQQLRNPVESATVRVQHLIYDHLQRELYENAYI